MKPRYIALTVLYCSAIFWLSADPSPPVPKDVFPAQDKLLHAVMFGGLAALVSVGVRHRGKPVRASLQFWLPVLFVLVYGISDEFHQLFVPNRHADPWDVVFDTLGGVTVQCVLCVRVWRIFGRA